MKAATAQSPFTDTITWRIVIEKRGTHRLHSMRLRADMPIRSIMEEILALYHREKPWWSRCLSQHVVETASIHTDTDIDIENRPNDGQKVRITERHPSNLISATHDMSAASFHNPVGANGCADAILLRPKLTYVGLCILAMTVLLAIVVPGALFGVMVGQAELGIALSAAITGVFALVGKTRGWLT